MLPRLILIANRFTDKKIADRVQEAVRAGVRWVHLRDHQADQRQFLECAYSLVENLQDDVPDVMISINGRIEVANELALHYHTGRHGTLPDDDWEEDRKTGYSAHKLEESELSHSHGIDYMFYSPVFATSSKPGRPVLGVRALRKFCSSVAPTPVYALGGITAENAPACLEAGAHGVAVLSGILDASDIEVAVQFYLKGVGGR